ncbi:MAG: hypothetical protein IKB84_06670 [Clostridia bacterium]|nr:hypothetical protein [Clostridia bacterium]
MYNEKSLDTLCAALAEVMGVERPAEANEPNELLVNYAKEKFEGRTPTECLCSTPMLSRSGFTRSTPSFALRLRSGQSLRCPSAP